MHLRKYLPLAVAFPLLLAMMPAASSTQHPNFPQFASPITAYKINKSTVTFATNQSADAILVNITDSAIYRYVNVSFDGKAWIQRSFQAGQPASCIAHPADATVTWLTGTCTLTITITASNFSLTTPGTSKLRNFITAFSCSELVMAVPLKENFRLGWDCHGSAYTPGMWQILNFTAMIPCVPNCAGKDCGSDGCGGSCGSCSTWEFTGDHASFSCVSSLCVPSCTAGWGNCDGSRTNGCEGNLTTNQYCGSCTNSCCSTSGCNPRTYCVDCTGISTGQCAGHSGLSCLAQSTFQSPPTIPTPPP